MEQEPIFNEEAERSRARELLGLRDFPERTRVEKRELLRSGERLATFENITTNTWPVKKKSEMKRGVVLELVKKDLLTTEILQTHPLVYIGSGLDVEYPLALGGRHIIMVDPIFSDPQSEEEIIKKIKKIIEREVNKGFLTGQINFTFDFGVGVEPVIVQLVPKMYERDDNGGVIPDQAGAIVLYASHGPSGRVEIDDSMRLKLIDGGIILSEVKVIKKDGGVVELGQ